MNVVRVAWIPKSSGAAPYDQKGCSEIWDPLPNLVVPQGHAADCTVPLKAFPPPASRGDQRETDPP
jgi:hypothetical protein